MFEKYVPGKWRGGARSSFPFLSIHETGRFYVSAKARRMMGRNKPRCELSFDATKRLIGLRLLLKSDQSISCLARTGWDGSAFVDQFNITERGQFPLEYSKKSDLWIADLTKPIK